MKKRAWVIVLSGLLLAVAAYACAYLAGTARQRAVDNSSRPALAWMQQEYHLDDAQFARLCEAHDAYRPTCSAMCRKIDEKNVQIAKLLAATNAVTPQIQKALTEAAQIRAECEGAMLEHFYEVARTMPPKQGKRYLSWVQQETLKPRQMMPGGSDMDSMPGM